RYSQTSRRPSDHGLTGRMTTVGGAGCSSGACGSARLSRSGTVSVAGFTALRYPACCAVPPRRVQLPDALADDRLPARAALEVAQAERGEHPVRGHHVRRVPDPVGRAGREMAHVQVGLGALPAVAALLGHVAVAVVLVDGEDDLRRVDERHAERTG